MEGLPPSLDPRKAGGAVGTGSKIAAEEIRALIPVGLAHHVHIQRTLLGQSMQEFVVGALLRHIEAIGHLKLDITPSAGTGVAVVVAERDEPVSRLPRRGQAGAAGAPEPAGDGGER